MRQEQSRSKSPAARILSLALALCMIAAFVPAITLTAGAAELGIGDTIVVNNTTYTIASENLVENGTFEDGLGGWYSYGSSGPQTLNSDAAQSTAQYHSGTHSFYNVNRGGGGDGINTYGQFALNDGDTVDKDTQYVLSFWVYSAATSMTVTVGLTDSENSTSVDTSCGGTGNSEKEGCNVVGLPAGDWYEMKYLLTASDASKYAIIYLRWITAYIDDVTLYKVENATKDTEVEVSGIPYKITSGVNLADMGSFDGGHGMFSYVYNWTTTTGANTSSYTSAYSLVNNDEDDLYLQVRADYQSGYYTYFQATNSVGYAVPTKYWSGAEAGKMYYISFDAMVSNKTNNAGGMSFIYLGAYESNSTYAKFETRTDDLGSGEIYQPSLSSTNTWETFSSILDLTDATSSGYFGFQWEWICDHSSYVGIDNITIFEVEKIPTTVTVKSVDASGNAVVAEQTFEGYVGDVYTYDTTSVGVITGDDGNTYVLDSDASTSSVTLSKDESANVIELIYSQDKPVKVDEEISATTRVGLAPTLPTTVTAIGESGKEIANLAAEWDINESKYAQAGEVEVTGWLTADPSVTFTATLTVEDKSKYLIVSQSFDGENFAKTDGDVGYIQMTGSVGTTEGISGNAASFEYNTANYLTITSDEAGEKADLLVGPDDLTISMFIKSEGNTWPFFATPDTSVKNGAENYLALYQDGSATNLQYERYLGGRSSGTSSKSEMVTIEADKWYAVTLVAKGAKTTLYVNGTQVATSTLTDTTSTIGDMFATTSYIYLGYALWGESYTGAIDNLNIYSIALEESEIEDIAGVKEETITYQYEGTPVYTEEVSGFEGQSVELVSGFFGTDGVRYVNKTTTYVIGSGETTIAVEKSDAEITESETVSTSVIDGTTPILPETITVTYDDATTAEAEVTWDLSTLDEDVTEVAYSTIKGTITNIVTDYEPTATVTVYPMSFEMNETYSSGAWQNTDWVHEFPVSVTGENIVVEFTAKFSAFTGAGTITIGDSTAASNGVPVFGAGGDAISIQTNSDGTLNIRRFGDSGGGSSEGTTYYAVNTDEEYHFVVTTNTTAHTYSVVFTAPDGTQTVVEDRTYRNTASTYLNSITILENNSQSNTITVSNVKVYAPGNGIESYTVNTNINDKTWTQYTTDTGKLGYGDDVIYPDVEIPYYEGYIFTSKSIDEDNAIVTLNYTETTVVDDVSAFGENFFSNVDADTTFVSLNMLGAHDAFTASISASDPKYDAAAMKQNESISNGAYGARLSASTAAPMSKAQDKTVLELLESGVRYFDIRLSRSDADETYLFSNFPNTNGVFYTTHSMLSDEFRPIAYTIGQWLKEHKGEIVVLDFQEAYDYTDDGSSGTATSSTYAAINDILEEAGINDFANYYNGVTSIKNVTYTMLTNGGQTSGAVMFARQIGYSEGNFYPRVLAGTYSEKQNWEDGKLYSYYDDGNTYTSFNESYIQTQVDTLDKYNDVDDPGDGQDSSSTGDHAAYHYARVMQAQATGASNLITTATNDRSSLMSALQSNADWLSALPIVMVDAAGTDTDELAALLQSCNEAQDVVISYVAGDTTVATTTKSLMVGTIFTDETQYLLMNSEAQGDENKYYVTNKYTVKPSTCTTGEGKAADVDSTITLYDITYVPSNKALSIPVTAVGDVYTYVADGTYGNTAGAVYGGDLDDDGVYSALTNFGAFNWGSSGTYDRIGVAVLKLDEKTGAENYVLTATIARKFGSPSTKLYAIPYSTYVEMDMTDIATYLADESYLVASDVDESASPAAIVLDADAIETIMAGEESGKIVILGVSVGGLYGLAGSDIQIEVQDKDLGVTLVDGAQIRIGGGLTTEDKVGEDSGLRFIAVVDTTGSTIAGYAKEEGVEGTYGIAIWDGGHGTTAVYDQDDNPAAKVDVYKYQDADESGDGTVFTVAITNISSDNYNQIYVAVPYVKITENGTDTYYYDYDAAVARTPYQVASGILIDSDAQNITGSNGTTYVYSAEADETLIKVLNAYANMTGARITLTRNKDDEGNYTSYSFAEAVYANSADDETGAKAFFTVTAEGSIAEGYTVTLTPLGNAEFYGYAEDYYRVNNAHQAFIDNFKDLGEGVKAEIDGEGNLVITIPGTATE